MSEVSATLVAAYIALSWSAPVKNVDGTAIIEPLTYNVYRSHNGAAYKLTPHAGIKATTVNITGNIVTGATDCFQVTAIESGVEGAATSPTCIVIP